MLFTSFDEVILLFIYFSLNMGMVSLCCSYKLWNPILAHTEPINLFTSCHSNWAIYSLTFKNYAGLGNGSHETIGQLLVTQAHTVGQTTSVTGETFDISGQWHVSGTCWVFPTCSAHVSDFQHLKVLVSMIKAQLVQKCLRGGNLPCQVSLTSAWSQTQRPTKWSGKPHEGNEGWALNVGCQKYTLSS